VEVGLLRKLLKRIKRDGFLATFDYIIGRVLRALPQSVYRLLFEYDVAQRHMVVVSEIERMTTGGKLSILNVGSGPEGLGTYIRRETSDVVFLDIRFLSLLAAKTTGQKAVLGSGLSLPFADDAFDVVVSLHVLEHIPASEKELFVREVKRGSNKYVIILTPCGEHAEQLAKRLLAWKP
jgi:SAM-dependent methyltransferase